MPVRIVANYISDPAMRRHMVTTIKSVLSPSPLQWSVSILKSPSDSRWEMRVERDNLRTRIFLEGPAELSVEFIRLQMSRLLVE